MIRKLFLTSLLLLAFSTSFGRGGLLDIVISVEIKSTPVGTILQTIERKANVIFSYNLDVVDENRIVSLSIKEKTIRYGLSLIFDDNIRFKEVGSHIVLLQNEEKEVVKACKKEKLQYVFEGVVLDKRSGKPVKGASVYEIDGRYATLTDAQGKYRLVIPDNCGLLSIYFKKKGYQADVIVVQGDASHTMVTDIDLTPIESDVAGLENSEIKQVEQTISQKAISGQLLSNDIYLHGQNLEDVKDTRWAQISFIPSLSIGSNLSTNALIYNHFSFNVLGGFSRGVKGMEIGGLFNINKENVTGAQIGGLTNLTGGDVLGVQVGGLSNLVQGNVTGAQIGGISSIMKQDLLGLQLSGIVSVVRGGFDGVQVSGIGNFAWKKSRGAQVSGIFNMVKDSLVGGQIAGISNVSRGGTNYIQLAGVTNYADTNIGLQAAGVFNFARENRALQIGLFNCSLRGKGAAIGLFNFVKEGYHKTEVSANEIFPVNVTLKSGTQRLYNTYNFGAKFGPNRAYGLGVGFGSYFNLTKNEKLKLSLDLSGQMVFENDFERFEFAQLYKISTTIDYQLAKWVTVFGGPSVNFNRQSFQDTDGNYSTNISFLPLSDNTDPTGRSIFWIGGQIGFRF